MRPENEQYKFQDFSGMECLLPVWEQFDNIKSVGVLVIFGYPNHYHWSADRSGVLSVGIKRILHM